MLSFEGEIGSVFYIPSKIHSSDRHISFQRMGLGITVLDLEKSVWRRRVSPFLLLKQCFVEKAETIAL